MTRSGQNFDALVSQGKKTNFQMQAFGAVMGYRESWAASRQRTSCAICNGAGMVAITDEQGTRMRACSHGQTAPSPEARN